jgi:galactose mutarotase-like enzyme
VTVDLHAGNASVAIDPADGGRMTSLRIGQFELLCNVGNDPTMYGSFVMAPYAGRVRAGTFTHHDTHVSLPINLPPHAAHGLALDRPWTVLEQDENSAILSCEFDQRWPFGGRVVHYTRIEPDRLVQKLAVEADQRSFPASIGWHPWFARRLAHTTPAQVWLEASAMLRRDADSITTRQRMRPTDGPWDDTFVDVDWPVSVNWPGVLRLDIDADTSYVVVFDEGEVALCVEPQTSPPNSVNSDPLVVRPGRPLRARTDWRWVIHP